MLLFHFFAQIQLFYDTIHSVPVLCSSFLPSRERTIHSAVHSHVLPFWCCVEQYASTIGVNKYSNKSTYRITEGCCIRSLWANGPFYSMIFSKGIYNLFFYAIPNKSFIILSFGVKYAAFIYLFIYLLNQSMKFYMHLQYLNSAKIANDSHFLTTAIRLPHEYQVNTLFTA